MIHDIVIAFAFTAFIAFIELMLILTIFVKIDELFKHLIFTSTAS